MTRRNITDRTLQALKPAPAGKHRDIWDRDGFGVRVSDKGTKTFVLMARYPGSSNPTRRAIGHYPTVSLAAARATASQWREWIAVGKDPAVEIERQRFAEQQKSATTFAAVAEDFIRDKLPGERKGVEVERELRRIFLSVWGKRPITDITPLDVRNAIKKFKDEGKTFQAHNSLALARRLFNWAIAQHCYGIEASPCDKLKPKDIIGAKRSRTRILSDAELRAAWSATETLGYPYAPLFRLLMVTGQRKSEVGEARWSEFDLAKKIWTIPVDRMKADAAHVVPLSDDAIAILTSLPKFNRGDHLFTTTFGKIPVNGFHKAKMCFDAVVNAKLGYKAPPWTLHDIRRTVRTQLSAIPSISDLVRELVIGHTKPGLHKIYDQYAYLDEKRSALDAWAVRLRSIIEPAPANVVELRAAL
jgi:integrase